MIINLRLGDFFIVFSASKQIIHFEIPFMSNYYNKEINYEVLNLVMSIFLIMKRRYTAIFKIFTHCIISYRGAWNSLSSNLLCMKFIIQETYYYMKFIIQEIYYYMKFIIQEMYYYMKFIIHEIYL